MVKKLYKGIFVLNRETFIEYVYAYTVNQAKNIIIRRIARKHGVIPIIVFGYFKDHPGSYIVKEEK